MYLSRMTSDHELGKYTDSLMKTLAHEIRKNPQVHTCSLTGMTLMRIGSTELIVAGGKGDTATEEILSAIHDYFLPGLSVLFKPSDSDTSELEKLVPRTAGYQSNNDSPTIFLCHDFTCEKPMTEINEILMSLKNIREKT